MPNRSTSRHQRSPSSTGLGLHAITATQQPHRIGSGASNRQLVVGGTAVAQQRQLQQQGVRPTCSEAGRAKNNISSAGLVHAEVDYDDTTYEEEEVFLDDVTQASTASRLSSPVFQLGPSRPARGLTATTIESPLPPSVLATTKEPRRGLMPRTLPPPAIAARIAILSDGGAAVCRICHGSEFSMPFTGKAKSIGEPLISPCHCSGTMGLYHRTCLEKWLAASKESKCEICQFSFEVRRQPKPLAEFIRNPGNRSDKRNMIGDLICWCLLTPLAFSSMYLCIHGAVYYANHSHTQVEIPGLVVLAVFLVVTYTIWITISLRYHYTTWQEWKQNNQEVKLVETPLAIKTAGGPQHQPPRRKLASVEMDRNNNILGTTEGAADDAAVRTLSTHTDASHLDRPPIFSSTPAVPALTTNEETTVSVHHFDYSARDSGTPGGGSPPTRPGVSPPVPPAATTTTPVSLRSMVAARNYETLV